MNLIQKTETFKKKIVSCNPDLRFYSRTFLKKNDKDMSTYLELQAEFGEFILELKQLQQ